MNNTDCVYTYIDSAGTYNLFTGKGVFNAIVLTDTLTGAIGVEDGVNTVATIPAGTPRGTYRFDCAIANSLSIVVSDPVKITVTWSK